MNTKPKSKQAKHPYIGTQVGQYSIDELIGGGAMGQVFRAHQHSIGRDVAVKFLSYNQKSDELGQKRMAREAKAMGKLNHPGLVSTYEFGTTDYGQPYIVMEYLKGEPLSELLSREVTLTPEKTVAFSKQLAKAMDYSHRNGVIHRDIKPANIMVSMEPKEEFLKVFDFGIARLTQDSQLLTRPGMVMGSPVYMSPEQCKGQDTDARSDIYALGVIMYLSLTGSYPIIGEGGQMTMIHKISKEPLPISKIAPNLNIHWSLEKLIMSMLSIDPLLRPQTMSHVIQELNLIEENSNYVENKKNAGCSKAGFELPTRIPPVNMENSLDRTEKEIVSNDPTLNTLVSIMLVLVVTVFSYTSIKKEWIQSTEQTSSLNSSIATNQSNFNSAEKRNEILAKPSVFPSQQNKTNKYNLSEKTKQKEELKEEKPTSNTKQVAKLPKRKSNHKLIPVSYQTPIQKFNSLDPHSRRQLKSELISYFKKKNKANSNKYRSRTKRTRSWNPNSQHLYGRTPYNQLH